MSELRYPQWRNENDYGKYPFAQDATLTNDSVIIPNTLFADARIYTVGGSQNQYLSQIDKDDQYVTFVISDEVAGAVASGVYEIGAVNDRGVVPLLDTHGRSAGVLVTDETRMIPVLGWVSGEYDFTIDQTLFACGVVTPLPITNGVRSFYTNSSSDIVSDDVYITGGRGVVLEAVKEGDDIIITVNAVGEPLYKQLICSPSVFSNPCKLRTINGLKPDQYGNFQIVPCCLETDNTLIRVYPIENGIKVLTVGGS